MTFILRDQTRNIAMTAHLFADRCEAIIMGTGKLCVARTDMRMTQRDVESSRSLPIKISPRISV